MSAPLGPGATLGVLGGGQLGRMFGLAARRLGYHVDVFTPEDDSPAGQVARRVVRAAWEHTDAVQAFARGVDVITFEFENIPAATVEAAARHAPVRPSGELLLATQERLREKRSLVELGLPVARHGAITEANDLATAACAAGFPAVLKTAAWGYDGKGQVRVGADTDLPAAWRELGEGRAVLEGIVPFEAELSVIGARGTDGTVALYEPFFNYHVDHILDVTIVPAPITAATRTRAHDIARTVLEGFDVVGVLCVEMFLLADGELVVNEVAPRTHNSGHVTLDAHATSQFEQQVRAICGLPLGSVERTAPAAAMANLLGDLWSAGPPKWEAALQDDGVHLHLYGKRDARPGRKMGHLSVTDESVQRAEERARGARAVLDSQRH